MRLHAVVPQQERRRRRRLQLWAELQRWRAEGHRHNDAGAVATGHHLADRCTFMVWGALPSLTFRVDNETADGSRYPHAARRKRPVRTRPGVAPSISAVRR